MNKELQRTRLIYGVAIVVLAVVASYLVVHTTSVGSVYASSGSLL